MVSVKSQRSSPETGTFSVEIGVGSLDSGPLTPVSAVVGSSAFDSVLPASLLKGLGVEPLEREVYSLADGSEMECEIGTARIALDGREWYCPVVFGPEDKYLLGTTTLEIFRLMVDSEGQQLVRRPMFGRPL